MLAALSCRLKLQNTPEELLREWLPRGGGAEPRLRGLPLLCGGRPLWLPLPPPLTRRALGGMAGMLALLRLLPPLPLLGPAKAMRMDRPTGPDHLETFATSILHLLQNM